GLAEEPPPPESIGRFEVLDEVGRGGMGSILRVRDPDLRREMAVKLVHADEVSAWAGAGISEFGSGSAQVSRKAHGRFLEEAQVTSQLAHPGIVPVHGLGELPDGRPYFTMQLVQGRNLREIFQLVEKGEEGWTRTRALGVCLRVCEAMAYAHSKGVIHRDLKPSNVMVGEFGEVYVMDWGVARVLGRRDAHDRKLRQAIDSARQTKRATPADGDSNLYTMDGDVVGTPVYMAPEQAEGNLELVGERSDVYSVGALLYHLLSGQVPYVEPDERPSGHEVLRRVIEGPPVSVAIVAQDAPAELAAICDKAMGRKPGDRYGSMQVLGDDLRAYLEHRVVQAYETGALAEFRKWVRRNRKLSAALAFALVAVLGGLVAVTVQQITSRKALELEGDIHLLSFLRQRADELWPSTPAKVPELEEWLASAGAMLSREPRHEVKLARLQQAADPALVHQERFLRELDEFSAQERGLLEQVRHRLSFAQTIEARSLFDDGPARAWREAIVRIAKSGRYAGLEITPQLGLVPIGPDPVSGLEEFADVATGALPLRSNGEPIQSRPGNSLVFVLLPGGSFEMGCPEEGETGWHHKAIRDEWPAHSVALEPFLISKFEMTQGQYLRGLGHNPSRFAPGTEVGEYIRTETHPVERLSWIDAAEAMRRLDWSLPTEAQWEYAARAGTRTAWFTGETKETVRGFINVADAAAAGRGWQVLWPELDDGWIHHAPVDAFAPNPWGLHGILGNCWEWCRDWKGGYDLPVDPRDGERQVDPEQRSSRVYRGSSFKHSLYKTRSSDRG
ncbi:MAG: bifunctional serine/threonine-protein kinase/formylglycine-generating enzyme family protein, partial [Planctomycetota bacterium]